MASKTLSLNLSEFSLPFAHVPGTVAVFWGQSTLFDSDILYVLDNETPYLQILCSLIIKNRDYLLKNRHGWITLVS
jgi:hypothetical protein